MELRSYATPPCTVADCDPCKTLQELDKCLSDARKLVASLKIERKVLIPALNASHDPMMGRLPLEIASYIFKIFVDTEGYTLSWPGAPTGLKCMTDAPLILGAVCRGWRTIVWSSPQLWTTMAICIGSMGNCGLLELAEQWLERTGSCPLSICLYESEFFDAQDVDFDSSEKDELKKIIELINSVSDRWLDLTVELGCKFLQRIRGTHDKKRPSILRRLCLSSTEKEFPMQRFLKSNLGHLPASLAISHVRLSRKSAELKNVTHFEASSLSMDECLQVLQQAHRLTDLSLTLDKNLLFNDTDNILRDRIITHPGLRSLTLRQAESDFPAADLAATRNLAAIVNLSTLPSLEKLQIFGTYSDPTPMISSLISLLERSSCQLKLFRLDRSDGLAEQLIRLLRIAPSVEFLHVTFDEAPSRDQFFKNFMKARSENTGRPIILPILKTITTDISNVPRNSLDAFLSLDILDADYDGQYLKLHGPRADPLPLLKLHFSIWQKRYINKSTLHRLSKLVEKGILISISRFSQHDDFIAESLAFHAFHASKGERPVMGYTHVPDTT